MANDRRRWTLVLRCHACDGKFAVQNLSMDRLAVVTEVAPCPHCSARPVLAPAPDLFEESKLHRIFDLKLETSFVYRKDQGDTWHFAEECSGWPTEKYEERETLPGGELCNECKAKQTNPAF